MSELYVQLYSPNKTAYSVPDAADCSGNGFATIRGANC